MKRITIFLSIIFALSQTTFAQHRVLGEVKKKLNTITLTADVYKGALNTLKPALSNDETKNLAETWYLQGRLQYGFYDKCLDTKSIGKKVDVKAMGHALIDGYTGFEKALSLDTIVETDKNGKVKVDKKSGLPRYKTKYSSEIISKLSSRHSDYNLVGSELYNVQDWDGAFSSWDAYCDINNLLLLKTGKCLPDTIIGQVRYYQALVKWQKGDNESAIKYFALARSLGYTKKESYDYALVCMSTIDDDAGLILLAREAYNKFGVSDPQYVRILINDNINNKQYDKANVMLDQVIAVNDSDAEIFNLKGIVVEHEHDIAQAFPYYKKCIELNPDNIQGLFNVGRYYYNEATNVPDKFPKLSGRKLDEKAMPLYREAMPYMEKVYSLDPTNQDARNALRTIYYRLREGKKLKQIEN